MRSGSDFGSRHAEAAFRERIAAHVEGSARVFIAECAGAIVGHASLGLSGFAPRRTFSGSICASTLVIGAKATVEHCLSACSLGFERIPATIHFSI